MEVHNSDGESDDDEPDQLASSTSGIDADVFPEGCLNIDIPYMKEEIVNEGQNKDRCDMDNAKNCVVMSTSNSMFHGLTKKLLNSSPVSVSFKPVIIIFSI